MQIAILLYEGVTALDAVGPYEVLSRLPQSSVCFVAKDLAPKRTDTGMLALVPAATLADLPHPDVVVIPGALDGVKAAMQDEQILAWVRGAHESSRWTTSVCSGALILGAAGLLSGLKATTHWAARKLLSGFGAEPVPDRVVQQGKIITAAGVSAGLDMALQLAQQLAGTEAAQAIQLIIEYDPQPPFDTGSVQKAPAAVTRAATRALMQGGRL